MFVDAPARGKPTILARRDVQTSARRRQGPDWRGSTPRGAFYVFADIRPTGLTSRDFSLRLLEEQKVAVVPGTAFGKDGEGFVRCSYATSLEQIKIAMERMAKFVGALRN